MGNNRVLLHLISSLGYFGAENAMIELAKELRACKYTPFIGVIGNSCNSHLAVVKEAEKNNLESKIFYCKGKFDMGTVFNIMRYIKEKKIDIIHSHNYKSNFYAVLSGANMDIKKITTCHNWIGKNIKMKFYEYLDKLLLRRFDKVIVVSEILRDEVTTSGVLSDKVIVVNNGINVNRFLVLSLKSQVRNSLGIEEEDYIVGTVGRLTPEKGHTYLLKAFKEAVSEYPKMKLLIVGDGMLKDSLETAAKRLALESKVIFTGVREDIPQILNIMDVFVLPSLTEGSPMALLEAMVSKKSVIATKVGSIPEIIKDGYSGLLVEPGDVMHLSNAIKELFKNKEKAGFLSANAYETINEKYSAKKMGQKYVEIYESLFKN